VLSYNNYHHISHDPYPEKGIATGRAFEVGGLKSWEQPFRQVSLKNIIRLIHKSYNNITRYEDIPSFTEIKKEIKAGRFPILPLTSCSCRGKNRVSCC